MESDESEPGPEPESLSSEQQLVVDAKGGDERARGILVERFQPLVRRYLEKRMGDRLLRFSTVEDLLQDVLLRGMKGIHLMREGATPDEFRGLLLRHAQWVLLDRGRTSGGFMGESTALRACGPENSAAPAPGDERFADRPKTDGAVTVDDQNNWLRDLVSQLDEKYASVVRLYLAGRTYVEIGVELGISTETARKRFLRAAMKLNDRTADTEPGSPPPPHI